jgi:hypothetical protein
MSFDHSKMRRSRESSPPLRGGASGAAASVLIGDRLFVASQAACDPRFEDCSSNWVLVYSPFD